MDDDPVPLERVDVVRLLVEQAPLEFADIAPALLAVGGPALLLVELVERPVHVAAVVDGAHVHRLELEQGQVRLDDVAAVEVGRDLEVAAEDGAVETTTSRSPAVTRTSSSSGRTWGGFDQREAPGFHGCRRPYLPLGSRPDVLVFQTEPLREPTEVTGPIGHRLPPPG